jgi:hypothetical protein
VGAARRRGASARGRRHWCRCSDPRAPPDLSHSGDAEQRPTVVARRPGRTGLPPRPNFGR